MRILKFLSVLLLACGLGVCAVSGCGASKPQIPVAAMPAGESFTGLWYTNYGDMKLNQTPDGKVNGTFSFKTGGNITGTVEGGVMKFDWEQPGDFAVGRRSVAGKGYLVVYVDSEGTKVKGEWGYGEKYSGGGNWTGTKATEIYR